MNDTNFTCPKCGAEIPLIEAITHTAMLYGGIQGIAGREALPPIQRLQLSEQSPPVPLPQPAIPA